MAEAQGPVAVIREDERDVVFVSYARANGEKIAPLVEAMQEAGTRVWMDIEDIRLGTEWIHEIQAGITNARAFLALLSPEYLDSSACLDELRFACESGKAIVPIVLGDIRGQDVPMPLAALHWITWKPGTSATDAASEIASAVSTDIRWSNLHSQLQTRAAAWSDKGRPPSALLRGSELDEAERELSISRDDGQPFPTPLQRDYVLAGRVHQRRFARRVILAVSLVAVLSIVLAGVAVWQRVEATHSAEQAKRALAKSDFERFHAAAANSPDMTRRARFSLAASAAAKYAGLASAQAVLPLVGAFEGADEKPVIRFDIRPESQPYTGDHEGVAVSGDGSTLAYLGLDGVLSVVDLWTLDERARLSPAGWPDHYLPQVALNFDGTRLLYAAGATDSNGLIREYDISATSPSVEVEELVHLGDPLAAVAFGPKPQSYTVVQVSGEIVIVELTSDEPHLTLLGDRAERSNAGIMMVTFSRDANRVCLTGDAQALYQLSAPKLISAGTHLNNCVPEPCSASAENHIELGDDGQAACITPEGATVADMDDCEACTRRTRLYDEDGVVGYQATVPGPAGNQIVEYGLGVLSVYRHNDGTVPGARITALPDDIEQIWSSNGQDIVIPQPDGKVSFADDSQPIDPRADEEMVRALWDSPGQLLSTGEVGTVQEGRLEVRSGASTDPTLIVDAGIEAHAWFGDLVAISKDGRLELWDAAAPQIIDAQHLDSETCAIGWSVGGQALAVADCSVEGKSSVSVWSIIDGYLQDPLTTAVPLPAVDGVAVSDNSAVISVSRTSGEIAVWREGKWISDSRLNAAANETNDYHVGWSAVDETGSWLLARKNQAGIELWSIGDDGLSRGATLLNTDPFAPPVLLNFDDSTIELAWADVWAYSDVKEPQIRRWDLSPRALTKPLCLLASPTAVAENPVADDTWRYDDPCDSWTRDLPKKPAIAAPTIAELPVRGGDLDELILRNYDTVEFDPDFGLKQIVVDPSPTSILSLVGSHYADVEMDDLSVVRSGKLIDGKSFEYFVVDEGTLDHIAAEWCGDTYRFGATGPTQMVFSTGEEFIACNPIAVAAGVLWTISGDGFEGVDAEGGRHDVELPKSVATGHVQDLINADADELLTLIEPVGGGAPQMVRFDADKASVTTVDASGLVGPLATGSDGAVWAATERGVRLLREDGTTKDILFPDLGRVTSMTVDSSGRLWFITRTTIGLVTTDGVVRFKAVHDAESLSDIAFVRIGGYLAVLDSSTNTLIRFSTSES